jgi:hypothetical protein
MWRLTAICVIGLCGFAAERGWSITQFAERRAQMLAHQIPADAVRSWIGAPGLAGAALDASLIAAPAARAPDALGKRADGLAALLAARPMSSTDWLSLAGVRLLMGRPHDEIVAGFQMSSITGPNEGAVMVQRAILGLSQWEALPADARRQTIGDLAGAARADTIGEGAMAVTRNILRAKSMEIRSQIADFLRAERFSPAELDRMGL